VSESVARRQPHVLAEEIEFMMVIGPGALLYRRLNRPTGFAGNTTAQADDSPNRRLIARAGNW